MEMFLKLRIFLILYFKLISQIIEEDKLDNTEHINNLVKDNNKLITLN